MIKGSHKLTAAAVEEIVAAYRTGCPVTVIAEDHGVSRNAVRYHARRHGLTRPSGAHGHGPRSRTVTQVVNPPSPPTPRPRLTLASVGPVADPDRWIPRAACRNVDPEIFFHPEGERGPDGRNRDKAARAVCQECPVTRECLAHALHLPERYGMWGGTTAHQRARILNEAVA